MCTHMQWSPAEAIFNVRARTVTQQSYYDVFMSTANSPVQWCMSYTK